jgi:hypothetical protein
LLTLAEACMAAARAYFFARTANHSIPREFNRGLCFAQNKTAHSLVRRGFL